jgi:flagellar biogenesis protein FliO
VIRLAAIAGLVFLSGAITGAPPESLTYVPPATPEAPSAGQLIGKLFLLTGIMLAICFALLLATRKWAKSSKPGHKNGDLEYLASISLDRRTALHLIEADGHQVVIGTDLTGLKAMHILGEDDPFGDVLNAVRRQNAA